MERDCVLRLSDALRLGIPDSDLDRPAAQLTVQLEQMRRFERLGLPDPPGIRFDVRWKH
jgi:hypothetical protein